MSARESHAVSLACLIASAVALGHALQIANGFYDEAAVGWLTAALALWVSSLGPALDATIDVLREGWAGRPVCLGERPVLVTPRPVAADDPGHIGQGLGR